MSPSANVHACCFCGQLIQPTATDPCALGVVYGWLGARENWLEQELWCHYDCLGGVVHENTREFVIDPITLD